MERVKYNSIDTGEAGLKVGLKAAIKGLKSGVEQAKANQNTKLANELEMQLNKLYKIDNAVLNAVCDLQDENGGSLTI